MKTPKKQEKKKVVRRNWIKENLDEYLVNAIAQEKKIKVRIKRIRQVIKLRSENRMTMEEIGAKIGVSKQYISQILGQIELK